MLQRSVNVTPSDRAEETYSTAGDGASYSTVNPFSLTWVAMAVAQRESYRGNSGLRRDGFLRQREDENACRMEKDAWPFQRGLADKAVGEAGERGTANSATVPYGIDRGTGRRIILGLQMHC